MWLCGFTCLFYVSFRSLFLTLLCSIGLVANAGRNGMQYSWLKDTKTNEVVVVKGLPPTDASPPTLKCKAPSGVELRPYCFCNLHGLWKGEEFTVA